ncbi:MAG: polysaccharide deacetylase family protein [Actinomycetes bacterium]
MKRGVFSALSGASVVASAGLSVVVALGLCVGSSMPASGVAGLAMSSQSAPVRMAVGSASLPRVFNVKTRDKVFFITIDDGNFKTASALAYVRSRRLPVTAFITNAAIGQDWRYFRRITAFGGSVQNHTMTHKSLTGSTTNLPFEICKTQRIYAKKFGQTPTLLRPPYGNGGYSGTGKTAARAIATVARSCGISRLVMWNATADNGKFVFVRGSLHAGDVVLFHFKPNLANELAEVMAMAHRRGLHPAPLTDYLT